MGNGVDLIWTKKECISFLRVKDSWGELSNMSSFPIIVNGRTFRSSEALYQALRFPDCIEAQEKIIEQKSPMSAKMVSKPYREKYNMPNWEENRLEAMWWTLQAKLLCNWDTFHPVLCQTRRYHIVEQSHKDLFWGAKKYDNYFEGFNCLGQMLTELAKINKPYKLEPLEGFRIFGETPEIAR